MAGLDFKTNKPGNVEEHIFPLDELISLHKMRFKFVTSMGVIWMKRISLRDYLGMCETQEIKEYMRLANIAKPLSELAQNGVQLDEESIKILNACVEEMQKYQNIFLLPVFVSPVVNTLEEFDILLGSLPFKDRQTLLDNARILSNPVIEGKISDYAAILIKRFGISISNDISLENITMQQAMLLIKNVSDEMEEYNNG